MKDVVLVHGLWVPALVMSPLALMLARAGFRCHRFGYAGRTQPLAKHAGRLAAFARRHAPQGAHYVGHSFGGLVVMEALLRDATLAAGRVVLLGTPARGCAAGRQFARSGPGRWLLGASEAMWREHAAIWARPEPLGVIAGTVPLGLGRAFGRLAGANDGVVRVEETRVDGMAAHLSLPVGHSAMVVSPRVARAVRGFLEMGRFPHEAR